MTDRSITLAEFAKTYLGGKSAKTARRRLMEDRIPYHKDHGHILIRQSDAESWREARMTTPAAPSLKTLLQDISARVLRERQAVS
jgi:hypothetical protein